MLAEAASRYALSESVETVVRTRGDGNRDGVVVVGDDVEDVFDGDDGLNQPKAIPKRDRVRVTSQYPATRDRGPYFNRRGPRPSGGEHPLFAIILVGRLMAPL